MNSRDPVVRPGVDVHQYYTLDMPQVKSAALADIFSFTGTRGMCEPTKYMIQFTHPRHDLSRSEYLNHKAAFVMQPPAPTRWSQPEAPHRVPGVITSFAHLSDTRDQAVYEVVLESRLALLRNTPRYRHFIDRRIPEIIEQILRENDFDQILADYLFNLYRTYRKWEFVVQWGEDDLTFITRLCRMSGIWFVCEQGKRCEVVRFGDDFTYYTRNPEKLTVPLLEPSGLVTGGRESVKSLEMHSEVIPANYVVRSYSPEEGAVEPVDGRKFVYDDRTTYGEAYTWGTPYLGKVQAEEEALLRQEAALAAQITYTGTCDMLDLAPSCVLKLSNRDLPDAKYGLLAVRVTCSASRKQGYKVDFTAIPSDRQYRHPLEEHTWPRIEGVVTGTIASTKGYVGPYLDEQGRYIVHIHADRDQRTPGLESCPMRLAKPFGGPGQTGFHFGLEPGAVVTVAFLWGNPNLPFISQVLHTVQDTDPIHSGHPWAQRHTIRTRRNNTFQMEDREGEEHIKAATEHGKSQLNLGHVVDREIKARGQGFELRTDNKGSVRADGLLVTAWKQEKAQGSMTDMDAAQTQFNLTQAQAEGLASAATIARAEIADLKAENQWLKDELAGLKQAVIALTAPHGIGVATPSRLMVSTGKDTSFATSSGFNVNALKNIALAAVETVSVFAQRAGIRLLAMRGKVQIQAQSDAMELVSQDNMQFSSAAGTLTANAANGVILQGGGTAYVKVHGDNVEIGGAGELILKIAGIDKSGPGSLSLPLPKFAQSSVTNNEKFVLCDNLTGRPLANRQYRIQLANGKIVEGKTTANGETSISMDEVAQGLKLMLQKNRNA
ncbi:type VI secretion system Vgr family protein [Paraburkholderia heleia]|uniref:type VI secretion system Vgr family protein n=1 Tax=Paraburkholderia heleia TaxID=634127 RepID=UPI000693F87A|nr:type VI secretion system tip protein VgrG [Paraburkholderia heleia]